MFEEKLEALSQVMAEHLAMPFPPGFRGLDIEDQDMVMRTPTATPWAFSKARLTNSVVKA